MRDLPWPAFHGLVDYLINLLGLRRVIRFRLIDRSFNDEILSNLLSRCKTDALGLREPNNSGWGEIFAQFAYPPDRFMSVLLFHGLDTCKLRDTALLQRIQSISQLICTGAGGHQLPPRMALQSVCRVLFTRGQTLPTRWAIFEDENPDIFSISVETDAISVAASIGEPELLQSLLHAYPNVDLEMESKLFCRPLTAAAKVGHIESCDILMKAGANPIGMHERLLLQRKRLKYSTGYSNSVAADDALRAAARGGHLPLVERFFELAHHALGADADYTDVLIGAAQQGHTEVLIHLLQKIQIDLLAQGDSAIRLLAAAAEGGHTHTVAMFLDDGLIDIENLSPARVATALRRAIVNGREDTVRLLSKTRPQLVNTRGQSESPLGVAARQGDISIMQLLLVYGAEINEQRVFGDHPLVCAVEARQIQALRYLLEQGADISHEACGNKALDLAARLGYSDVVQVLLDAGVDINGTAKSMYGSPLMTAKVAGHDDVVAFLLKRGAKDVDPLSTEYRDDFLEGRKPYPRRPEPLLRP